MDIAGNEMPHNRKSTFKTNANCEVTPKQDLIVIYSQIQWGKCK